MDTIHRAVLQLIHSAKKNGYDPFDVRDAMMRVINMAIMETCMRTGMRDDDGRKVDLLTNINDFLTNAREELQRDLEHMVLTSLEQQDAQMGIVPPKSH